MNREEIISLMQCGDAVVRLENWLNELTGAGYDYKLNELSNVFDVLWKRSIYSDEKDIDQFYNVIVDIKIPCEERYERLFVG